MTFIGVDENGYGPVLGPLVVTAASINLPSATSSLAPDLWRLLGIKKEPDSDPEKPIVCDSKMVFNTTRRKETSAENTILAFFCLCFGFIPESADQFLKEMLVQPGTVHDQLCFCWKKEIGLGLTPERYKHILKIAQRLKKKADNSDIILEKPRCLLSCPSLFNNGLKDRNKSDLVIESGLALVRQHTKDGDGFAACLGKVGGSRYYRQHLSRFFEPEFDVAPTREEKNVSSYELRKSASGGTITYLQDGEDHSFLIALASLFGKYTRELFWRKTREYLGGGIRASGYRDPLTKRFIKETEETRKKLGIPDDCFLRRK